MISALCEIRIFNQTKNQKLGSNSFLVSIFSLPYARITEIRL